MYLNEDKYLRHSIKFSPLTMNFIISGLMLMRFVHAADDAIDSIDHKAVQYQYMCTNNFLCDNRSNKEPIPSRNAKHRNFPDICSFKGTACKRGLCTAISWKRSPEVVLKNLDWLPPTIEKMSMDLQEVQIGLHAKNLPRRLQYFRAFDCSLTDTIDIEGLPRNIVEFHVRKNFIGGSVSLLRMPVKLRVLDLAMNMIEKVTYDNALLSEALQEVHVYRSGGGTASKRLGKQKFQDPRIKLKQVKKPSIVWAQHLHTRLNRAPVERVRSNSV